MYTRWRVIYSRVPELHAVTAGAENHRWFVNWTYSPRLLIRFFVVFFFFVLFLFFVIIFCVWCLVSWLRQRGREKTYHVHLELSLARAFCRRETSELIFLFSSSGIKWFLFCFSRRSFFNRSLTLINNYIYNALAVVAEFVQYIRLRKDASVHESHDWRSQFF